MGFFSRFKVLGLGCGRVEGLGFGVKGMGLGLKDWDCMEILQSVRHVAKYVLFHNSAGLYYHKHAKSFVP